MSSFHREQGQLVVPSFVLFDEQICQILHPNETKKNNIRHISQADHSPH
jgi:hypothetical protein